MKMSKKPRKIADKNGDPVINLNLENKKLREKADEHKKRMFSNREIKKIIFNIKRESEIKKTKAFYKGLIFGSLIMFIISLVYFIILINLLIKKW
jgi:hypothetical protein